jgi:hypothetical protein
MLLRWDQVMQSSQLAGHASSRRPLLVAQQGRVRLGQVLALVAPVRWTQAQLRTRALPCKR